MFYEANSVNTSQLIKVEKDTFSALTFGSFIAKENESGVVEVDDFQLKEG